MTDTLVTTGRPTLARWRWTIIVDRLGRVRNIRVTTALGIIGVALFIQAGNRWIALAGVLLWAGSSPPTPPAPGPDLAVSPLLYHRLA